MSYEIFEDLESFLGALSARGVTGVALRAVQEIRPVSSKVGHAVVVGSTNWVTLKAYSNPTLLKLRLEDQDPIALRLKLESAGLTVRYNSDNIT